ncbi:MAG: class I SAM-dependent methyltransferase [Syntrophotaleaceae bacterium]
MAHRCPYWVGFFLITPLRRMIQDPEKILRPFVAEGMRVLDVGPAMGYFTLPMARLVGPKGKVLAVDIHEKLLQKLHKRACRAGLDDRIVTRVCEPTSLDLAEYEKAVDFALAFAVVHEVPDEEKLYADLFRLLKPGGECLLAEPRGHVSVATFTQTLDLAEKVGFKVSDSPPIGWSRVALLIKEKGE